MDQSDCGADMTIFSLSLISHPSYFMFLQLPQYMSSQVNQPPRSTSRSYVYFNLFHLTGGG